MPNRFDLQREALKRQLQTLPLKVGDLAVNFFENANAGIAKNIVNKQYLIRS